MPCAIADATADADLWAFLEAGFCRRSDPERVQPDWANLHDHIPELYVSAKAAEAELTMTMEDIIKGLVIYRGISKRDFAELKRSRNGVDNSEDALVPKCPDCQYTAKFHVREGNVWGPNNTEAANTLGGDGFANIVCPSGSGTQFLSFTKNKGKAFKYATTTLIGQKRELTKKGFLMVMDAKSLRREECIQQFSNVGDGKVDINGVNLGKSQEHTNNLMKRSQSADEWRSDISRKEKNKGKNLNISAYWGFIDKEILVTSSLKKIPLACLKIVPIDVKMPEEFNSITAQEKSKYVRVESVMSDGKTPVVRYVKEVDGGE